jgi:hypothetical protein
VRLQQRQTRSQQAKGTRAEQNAQRHQREYPEMPGQGSAREVENELGEQKELDRLTLSVELRSAAFRLWLLPAFSAGSGLSWHDEPLGQIGFIDYR